MTSAPPWIEVFVGLLLGVSGVVVVLSAIGFLVLPDFFLRLHPPAMAYTGGTWSVALAGVVYFAVVEPRAAPYPGVILVLLVLTVPVTTLMLARLALFRRRAAGAPDTPPPLSAIAAVAGVAPVQPEAAERQSTPG